MRSSASPCYIHIGAPKTGTTLLQKVFFENRAALEQRGVLYPDVSLRGYGHHDLAFLLAGGYPEWATPQPRSLDELEDELAATVQGHPGPLLISSENFFLLSRPESVQTLFAREGALARYQPRIVVYVRRQDEAHESWYNQTIKAQGCTYDFETCFERCHDLWDYRLQLDRWSGVFGSEAIIVRPYEQAQFVGGSLVEDMFAVLGLSSAGLLIPEERLNTGLNSDLLEFQRLINQLPLATVEKRRYHRQLIELSARTAGSGMFDEAPCIDGARRQAIIREYEAGNAAVAATYLRRQTLFEEQPKEAPATRGPVGLTVEKLTYILGWLLARSG